MREISFVEALEEDMSALFLLSHLWFAHKDHELEGVGEESADLALDLGVSVLFHSFLGYRGSNWVELTIFFLFELDEGVVEVLEYGPNLLRPKISLPLDLDGAGSDTFLEDLWQVEVWTGSG
jgi:hypothetical protein